MILTFNIEAPVNENWNEPGDDEDVFQADECDEVWDDAHFGVHVETEAREAERHEDGAEDGEDGAKGDAQLGPEQLDFRAWEVHIAELKENTTMVSRCYADVPFRVTPFGDAEFAKCVTEANHSWLSILM